MTYKVPLYENDVCIGRVTYTENLDTWNGRNYQNGGTGHHLGCGKTRTGKFFLVYGTNWQGESDRAEVVSEEEAKQQVMAIGHDRLYEKLFGAKIPSLD